MKNSLFEIIAVTTGTLIAFNLRIGNAVTSIVASIFNFINNIIKNIAEKLLMAIDKDKYCHAILSAKQAPELAELSLMMAASKLKDDAISRKMWTLDHTITLNKIGNALYINCNWEPSRVHQYLKSVVETIPGMVYMSGDDFDDKSPV